MEVYIGTSCSSMVYLLCENDNGNGNGSLIPVVDLVGGAGITVWVRVWGINGSTGTFDICVLDHQSNDLVGGTRILIPEDVDVMHQVNTETATERINRPSNETLNISPNPASDVLNVSYQQSEQISVTGLVLLDLSGHVVNRIESQRFDEAGEFRESLDISELTPGMYLLQVHTTKGVLVEKVVVAR
jgi:hypothetical protein